MEIQIDENRLLGRELRRPGLLLAYTHLLETLHPDVAIHGRMAATHTAVLAADLGLEDQRSTDLQIAAILHDIGKIALPRRVLDNPGKLSEEEWRLMRTHPATGARIVRMAGLDEIADWILAHHERPDGLGYPRGLSGWEIPVEARMIAVTDAYDAMTSDRPYRAALGHEEAIDELLRGAGSQFDAEIVDALTGVAGVASQRLHDLAY